MALPESEYGLTGFANQRGIEEILIFAVWIGHIGGLANFAFMVILAVDIDVVPVQGCGRKWIEGGSRCVTRLPHRRSLRRFRRV